MTRFWVLLMKKLPLFSMALLLAGILFAQGSRAEDYTRLNLPNDAPRSLRQRKYWLGRPSGGLFARWRTAGGGH